MATPGFLHGRARALRANPGVARLRVWELLRGGRLGVKFRREHPMVLGDVQLVVDFVAPRARLAVDFVDAGVPPRRRAALEGAGYRVLWLATSAVFAEGFEDRLREFVTGS